MTVQYFFLSQQIVGVWIYQSRNKTVTSNQKICIY